MPGINAGFYFIQIWYCHLRQNKIGTLQSLFMFYSTSKRPYKVYAKNNLKNKYVNWMQLKLDTPWKDGIYFIRKCPSYFQRKFSKYDQCRFWFKSLSICLELISKTNLIDQSSETNVKARFTAKCSVSTELKLRPADSHDVIRIHHIIKIKLIHGLEDFPFYNLQFYL